MITDHAFESFFQNPNVCMHCKQPRDQHESVKTEMGTTASLESVPTTPTETSQNRHAKVEQLIGTAKEKIARARRNEFSPEALALKGLEILLEESVVQEQRIAMLERNMGAHTHTTNLTPHTRTGAPIFDGD